MSKKQPKKSKAKSKGKADASKPLSEEQLKQVAGGATTDYYLKLDSAVSDSELKYVKLGGLTPTTRYIK